MYSYYEIVEGDTLDSIANKFQTTVEDLAKLNQLDPVYVPIVGNKILVPLTVPLFDYYEVKKGDTLYSIAEKYHLTVDNLAKLNGLILDDYIYEGTLLVIPREGTQFYITQDGDTLRSISNNLGVSREEFVKILLQNENIYLMPDQLIIYKK